MYHIRDIPRRGNFYHLLSYVYSHARTSDLPSPQSVCRIMFWPLWFITTQDTSLSFLPTPNLADSHPHIQDDVYHVTKFSDSFYLLTRYDSGPFFCKVRHPCLSRFRDSTLIRPTRTLPCSFGHINSKGSTLLEVPEVLFRTLTSRRTTEIQNKIALPFRHCKNDLLTTRLRTPLWESHLPFRIFVRRE